MNQPKQHHYLPESYLNRFTGKDNLLWIYDWKTNEFRAQSPFNTCKENNFNTLINLDGTKNLEVERLYSEIESNVKTVIDKLQQSQPIYFNQVSDLALFVAGMYSRIPVFREMYVDSQDKMRKAVMKMIIRTEDDAKQYIKNHTIKPSDFLDAIQNEKYSISIDKNKVIQMGLSMAAKTYELFYKQNWIIVRAHGDKSFVTSDAPLTLSPTAEYRPLGPFGGIGLSTPGVEKRFPLSHDLALVMLDVGETLRFGKMTYEGMREFNEFTASRSNRFLISRDKTLLESLVKAVRNNHGHDYGFEVITPFGGQSGLVAVTSKRRKL